MRFAVVLVSMAAVAFAHRTLGSNLALAGTLVAFALVVADLVGALVAAALVVAGDGAFLRSGDFGRVVNPGMVL